MTINTMIRISCISFVAIIVIVKNFISLDAVSDLDFIAITIVTEENDAIDRYKASAKSFEIDFEIIDAKKFVDTLSQTINLGGGQKINILKEFLKKYINNENLIVLFTESDSVVFQNNSNAIVEKFKQTGSKILFSAELYCWPNKLLKDSYPKVTDKEKRFLNGGAFIGYASYLYKILSQKNIEIDDSDQLYFTEIFLNETLRDLYQIKLDTKSDIFQNLNGALEEVVLEFRENFGYLRNIISDLIPVVIHANGPTNVDLNSLTNYIGHSWTPDKGCQQCENNQINLSSKLTSDYPRVTLVLFITHPTPFLEEYFNHIHELTYPKKKIDVLVYCLANNHFGVCSKFVNQSAKGYSSMKLLNSKEIPSEKMARNDMIDKVMDMGNDFVMVVDSVVHLTNKSTVEGLVSQNRSILAPMVTRREKLWSNFWGALGIDGYYARSHDYMDIVQLRKRGVWNVPFVNGVYMMTKSVVGKTVKVFSDLTDIEMDMMFCENAREREIFIHVDNRHSYGHLVVADNVNTSHLHNDLWELFDNPLDWEEKYIHPQYWDAVADNKTMADTSQPCPDVFWWPLLSERFCRDLIEEMEYFGQWSDGSNKDSRLEGGYENVPTRDIHMRQVDWEFHWIHVLTTYVYPMQTKLFSGYVDIPQARMNFVVRYRPDEQPVLRPHHDASSYSLNIALNLPGVNYEGGGTRFLRYDCELTQSRLGWVLMHPGRVTHLHEGLRTTNGTRYIFVTFINP